METLFRKKLESSGLTVEDAAQLGIEFIKDASLLGDFWQLPAMKINYSHVPGFFRVRRLMGAPSQAKYLQPKDSGVHAYFPTIGGSDWDMYKVATEHPLIITEGELKAAKAMKEGFPCIGLGGVNSYSSHALGGLIPDLIEFDWFKRYVYIIFDSDVMTKQQVCKALNNLAAALQDRGAFPRTCVLPSDTSKVGIDDFLVAHGPEAFRQLLQTAWPLGMAGLLHALNEKYCVVEKPHCVINLSNQFMYRYQDFASGAFTVQRAVFNTIEKGNIALTDVNCGKLWVNWPMRHEVSQLTYQPGQPREIERAGVKMYNTWLGWGVEPELGDVGPFMELFDYVFQEASADFKRWVLQWFAYPFQHPGEKLYTALLVIGAEQGTGKSFIGEIVGAVYGDYVPEVGILGHMHSINISERDFKSAFNGPIADKCFIRVDEIASSDTYAEANQIKNMITQRSVVINRKGIEQETRVDRANYYITSNYTRAAKIDRGDRRFAIHNVTVGRAPQALYKRVNDWFRDPEQKGLKALLHMFLHTDLEGFDPTAAAPLTAAKHEVIRASMTSAEAWIEMIMESPALLSMGETLSPDIMTAAEILAYFERDSGNSKYAPNRMTALLQDARMPRACSGSKITVFGITDYYYIVRNHQAWAKATKDEVVAYIQSTRVKGKGNGIKSF